MSHYIHLQILNEDICVYDYKNDLDESNLLYKFIQETERIMTLNYFQEFLSNIEKLYLQKSIYNLIHQISEDDLNSSTDKSYFPELHERYHLFFKENEYLYKIYDKLLTIYTTSYPIEVQQFSIKKDNYMLNYTGDVTLESDGFEPYEYLNFQNTKCYKKFYNRNSKIIDEILTEVSDHNITQFNNFFDNYFDIIENVSKLLNYFTDKKYKVIIKI